MWLAIMGVFSIPPPLSLSLQGYAFNVPVEWVQVNTLHLCMYVKRGYYPSVLSKDLNAVIMHPKEFIAVLNHSHP